MKEKITNYTCKSLNGAKELFELFKSMKLDNLNEKLFFNMYETGKEEIVFTVRFNTWQVGYNSSDQFFEVIETKIFE